MQTITVPRTHRPGADGRYCWCNGVLLPGPNGGILPYHNDAIGAVFGLMPAPWIVWWART